MSENELRDKVGKLEKHLIKGAEKSVGQLELRIKEKAKMRDRMNTDLASMERLLVELKRKLAKQQAGTGETVQP